MRFRRTVASTLDLLKILDFYGAVRARLRSQSALIITYHSVTPNPPPWLGHAVTPEAFEEHVDYLSHVGRVVPLEWLTDRIRHGKRLQPRTFCITFDDGRRDNYDHAYPILRERGLPATVFVVSGSIGGEATSFKLRHAMYTTTLAGVEIPDLGGQDLSSPQATSRAFAIVNEFLSRLPAHERHVRTEALLASLNAPQTEPLHARLTLTWDEARELQQNGMTIGAHTVTHPMLTGIPREEARDELTASKQRIEEEIGPPCQLFAYPYGDFDEETVRLVRESGYNAALTTVAQFISPQDDLFRLGRVSAGGNLRAFKADVSGLRPDLARMRDGR